MEKDVRVALEARRRELAEELARLTAPPEHCAAIEDSRNGIRSAKAAGMRVVAIPNLHFPPDDATLELADIKLASLAELSPSSVA